MILGDGTLRVKTLSEEETGLLITVRDGWRSIELTESQSNPRVKMIVHEVI